MITIIKNGQVLSPENLGKKDLLIVGKTIVNIADTIEPGIGIDNIFNKKDNRPLNKNFALYSPGRSVVISLALRLK